MDNEEITSATSVAYPATREHQAALKASLDAGDPNRIQGTLGGMSRAHRMKRIAKETGLGRESLYKSMRAGAGAEFNTVLNVLRVLGFRLEVSRITQSAS